MDEITERESSTEKINLFKGNESNMRAERKLVNIMITLLFELRKDMTRENALALVTNDADAFIGLSNKKKYQAASDLLETLKTHISKEGTPETEELMEDLAVFPDFLQQKAMIMAVHDLSNN